MVRTSWAPVRGGREEKRTLSKSALPETAARTTQPFGTHLLPVPEGASVVGCKTICPEAPQGRRTTLNQKLVSHTRHAVDSFGGNLTTQRVSEA